MDKQSLKQQEERFLASMELVIPDVPPKKQLKKLKDWIFIIEAMGGLTGEDTTATKKPILDAIDKLNSIQKGEK